jgi:HEAT repeat protein
MADRIALTLTGDATRDVPHLESRLGGDTMTSLESADILAAIGDLASLDVLVRFAGHRHPFMRRIAVEALGQHPLAPQAVTTILSLLHDASPVVVRAACASVARIGSEDARSRLRELGEAAEPSTRAAAIEALGAFGDPLQLEFFQHVLQHDTAPEVVRAAEGAVKKLITATNWRPFFDEWSGSPNPARRVAACTLAQRYASAADSARIDPLTRDPLARVRRAAWRASWRLRGASDWPATPLPPGHRREQKARQPSRNDGGSDQLYDLSDDPELNDRVSEILNVACHVFHHHADGTWKTVGKEYYASLLAREFAANAWLTRILLDLGDRVISMLVYRAIEKAKESPQ